MSRWGFFKSPLQFDCSNQVQIWTECVISCDKGLFWLRGNKMNPSKLTGWHTSHALRWKDDRKNGDEVGGGGGIPLDTTQTDHLSNKTNKPSGKMQQNGGSGEIHLIAGHRNTRQMGGRGGGGRWLSMLRFSFGQGCNRKKPIKTRVQQTDTRWARAALTPFEYADVKVF